MTREEIRATVLRVLGEIAPEADLASLDPRVELRKQLDLDSMDVLNFVVGLHEALQVDIPEADYPKYATLHDCVEQLASRASGECSSTFLASRLRSPSFTWTSSDPDRWERMSDEEDPGSD